MQATPTIQTTQVATLTAINFHDFLNSIGLSRIRYGRTLLRWIFDQPAKRFAREVSTFDQITGEQGLAASSMWLLRRFASELHVSGAANVPATGPVMIASNHPGAVDTIALFASIPRPDLSTLAAERPFLQALTHVHRHLVTVSEAVEDRARSVRTITRVFRQGRAILTFPAGKIEPDPLLQAGAVESLATWSDSISVFARLVPGLQIVPTMVSGVLSSAAQQHWLTKLRRQRKDRELFGAMLQIVLPRFHNVKVRIAFGEPVCVDDLAADRTATSVTQQVIDRARALIESPPPSTAWQRLM